MTARRRTARAVFAILAVLLPGQGALAQGPDEIGAFGAPFTEPTIDGTPTAERCVGEAGERRCKPAAGTMILLRDGRVLYFNALEGTENVTNGIALDFGKVSVNDQARLLDLAGVTWSQPSPADGNTAPGNRDSETLLPDGLLTDADENDHNDQALFCAAVTTLADGRVLVTGGTDYYTEPGVEGVPVGLAELEGIPTTRIFDPATNTFTATGSMGWGRWYPTTVTLPDGKVFVASGVTKLLKPLYPNRPADSGTNVRQTETYDPATGQWTYNGSSADRSLPLFPRLHLLPNGHVLFNAAGQVFNPFGQSYDEALWNLAASYDPTAKRWTDLGVPGLGTAHPGFRGSSFSLMLPLRPDADGRYTEARFLSAGGIIGTSPGTYLATKASLLATVDVSGPAPVYADEPTGDLNFARWYSTGVLLPDGSVLALSGADRDEVDFPGTGFPVTTPELFDPVTRTWKPMATASQARTYHNTAMLLPDGRVLVGGHAPIPTMYGTHQTLPGGFSPNDGRDPSFEIYSPPYLFQAGRPSILSAPTTAANGGTITVATTHVGQIESFVLARRTSITHLVDGDQRMVELRVLERNGNTFTLAVPDTAVLPEGPYLLFANRRSDDGLIPSVAASVSVG